jgi:hypothetical protein
MTAAGDGSLRAGNADREKVVAQLNEAFSEGRLDVGELDERVAAAYAAKTLGELVPLTADLPAPSSGRAPARRPAASPAPAPRSPDEHHGNRWAPVAGMFGVFLVNVLIWGAIALANGDGPYFWPVWLLIPVVFAAMGAISGSSRHDRRRELRQERQQDRLERRRDRWDDREN